MRMSMINIVLNFRDIYNSDKFSNKNLKLKETKPKETALSSQQRTISNNKIFRKYLQNYVVDDRQVLH